MRRSYGTLLAVLVVAVSGVYAVADHEWAGVEQAPERSNEVIRLASYNVLNLFDDIDDPSLEGDVDDCHSRDKTVRAKPEEQNAAAGAALRAMNADIVGFQEIESYDALIKFREAHLAGMGYDHAASLDVGNSRGIEQSVLSRFPIKEVQVWPHMELGGVHPELWNGRPNRYAGEPLLWRRSPICVTVEIPAGARGNKEAYELTVFGVHHKSGRGNDYWREAETAKVVELIHEMEAADPGRNIAVIGDFNAMMDAESLQNYIRADITDVFDGVSTVTEEAMITHESGRRIDFILTNKNLAAELVTESPFVLSTPLRERGANWRTTPPPAGYASDHLPLAVDIVPVEQ